MRTLILFPLMVLMGRAENTATTPVPKENKGWMPRHESINAKAKQGGIDLVYIGDSIVQQFETKGKEVWDYYYVPRRALNLGISGDRTQHVLWRIDHGNLDGVKPKLTIIMIGQNNGGHNTAQEIAEGVTAVVQRVQAKCPESKILLLAIFQRRPQITPERAVLDEANATIAKLADNKSIYYLNINSVFVKPDGSIPADLMPDFEHPSPLGNKVWAEAIESKVAELLGDKPLPPLKR
jgi:lysophospholipase L1-like esterase